MTTTSTPKIYVGTYAKYNNGNLFGKWLDLADYSSAEEFYNASKELHSDEDDPELMFQDWENDPGNFISESSINIGVWEYLNNINGMSEDEIIAYGEYISEMGNDPSDIEDFKESWNGKWDSEISFAENLVDDCYDLEKTMGNLSSYFDYEKFARDLFISDYWYSETGNVFRRF